MKRIALFLALLFPSSLLAIDASGPINHDEAISVELPVSEHLLNKGGRDGYGLCVFASVEHAAIWHNCEPLFGLLDWMTSKPGGGYPQKLDKMIREFCKSRNYAVPKYVQHTKGDMKFLKASLAAGRYPCVTYSGHDDVFYHYHISHMVNLVHLSEKWAVIHDNNFPGKYLWMTPDEFEQRWKERNGGWAVVLLDPPPPPLAQSWKDISRLQEKCPDVKHVRAARYVWKLLDGDPDRIYLYYADRQIGGYDMKNYVYRSLDCRGQWGRIQALPPGIALPETVDAPQPPPYETDEWFESRGWLHDYEKALKQSRDEKKPLLVVTEMETCLHCRRYDEVLREPEVSATCNRFVRLKLNRLLHKELLDKLQIKAFPTTLIAADDGTICERKEGFMDAKELLDMLHKHLPADDIDFGVDSKQIQSGGCWINGHECTADEANAAVGESDSELENFRLTLVSPDAQLRLRFMASGIDGDLRNRVTLQAYAPESWVVTARKLPLGVLLQSPDGKVLRHWPSCPQADQLSLDVREQLFPKPQPPLVSVPAVPSWALYGGALLLAYWLLRKEQPK